jgi:Fe-S cluster biogenesis protein NfuA
MGSKILLLLVLFLSCTLRCIPAFSFYSTAIPSFIRSRIGYSEGWNAGPRFMTIVSPFDPQGENTSQNSSDSVAVADKESELLDLTWENVELVLDSMRSYLIQDGGNVVIKDIDGPVVYLELQGACGTCPSSTMTMKMGLERGLKERIPEIQEVVQAIPEGPELNEEQVNVVLDGVRPFLKVAGGTIDIHDMRGIGGLQPTIVLNMGGNSKSLNSVKMEINQRLQRHFMVPGLRVEWTP